MSTFHEIERAILNLSQLEFQRLAAWIEELGESRLGIAEPPSARPVELGPPMTVEEYLDFESRSRNRHEYLAGEVFAMSGVSRRHNRIVRRLCEALGNHLAGGPCEVHFADVQVKLRVNRDDYVYYPDVMVVCDRGRDEDRFVTNPKLIIEVLSQSTEGVDRHEKRCNYRWISALEEYVIVAQKAAEVTVFRRREDWRPAALDSVDASLELRSIGLTVPLAQIYEREAAR